MRHPSTAFFVLFASLLLAGCGGDADTATASTQIAGEDSLPQPDAAAGSVTGMPNPGTPSVLPPPADDLAIDDGELDGALDDGSLVESSVPENPQETSTTGSKGEMVNLPAETMPTMPAPTPDPVEVRIAPPPES